MINVQDLIRARRVIKRFDPSNEVLYDVLSQGASKLPEVKDLDICNLLCKRGFFWNF